MMMSYTFGVSLGLSWEGSLRLRITPVGCLRNADGRAGPKRHTVGLSESLTSGSGQSRRFHDIRDESALPPTPDILRHLSGPLGGLFVQLIAVLDRQDVAHAIEMDGPITLRLRQAVGVLDDSGRYGVMVVV